MDIYYGGCEQGAWRTLLYENGVRHMSLSFMGLRRRVKHLSRWRLADKFPADVKVYLDSGAFTLNKPGSTVSVQEASEIREAYFQFVADNIHDLEFAGEFDADVLGAEAVLSSRESFWHSLPERKWMPVWHAGYGTGNLIALADQYPRVGVLQDDAGGDLTAVLNRLSGQTRLHGVSMTKMDMLEGIRWHSAGSTRWLAPTQYGETFVWTGRELKDYPKRYQENGRKRHRTWLAEQGFDTEAIEAGDNTELLRLSIWSWQKYAEHLNGVTPEAEPPPSPAAALPRPPVGLPFSDGRNEELAPASTEVAAERPRQLLPVIGFSYPDPASGEQPEATMTTPSTPLLQCSTCFMKDKCPMARPGSDCAYDIPVQIRTPAQLDAAEAALVEMQVQRVLLMRMIEQREGGYADPNLSSEITRATKMLRDRAAGRETFKLTVEAGGSQATNGMISRIFGSDAGDRLAIASQPVDSQSVMAEVLEAEVISDDG